MQSSCQLAVAFVGDPHQAGTSALLDSQLPLASVLLWEDSTDPTF